MICSSEVIQSLYMATVALAKWAREWSGLVAHRKRIYTGLKAWALSHQVWCSYCHRWITKPLETAQCWVFNIVSLFKKTTRNLISNRLHLILPLWGEWDKFWFSFIDTYSSYESPFLFTMPPSSGLILLPDLSLWDITMESCISSPQTRHLYYDKWDPIMNMFQNPLALPCTTSLEVATWLNITIVS